MHVSCARAGLLEGEGHEVLAYSEGEIGNGQSGGECGKGLEWAMLKWMSQLEAEMCGREVLMSTRRSVGLKPYLSESSVPKVRVI